MPVNGNRLSTPPRWAGSSFLRRPPSDGSPTLCRTASLRCAPFGLGASEPSRESRRRASRRRSSRFWRVAHVTALPRVLVAQFQSALRDAPERHRRGEHFERSCTGKTATIRRRCHEASTRLLLAADDEHADRSLLVSTSLTASSPSRSIQKTAHYSRPGIIKKCSKVGQPSSEGDRDQGISRRVRVTSNCPALYAAMRRCKEHLRGCRPGRPRPGRERRTGERDVWNNPASALPCGITRRTKLRLASFSYLPRSEIVLFTLPKAGDAASQWAFVESLPFEICALTSLRTTRAGTRRKRACGGSRGSTSITAGHVHFAAQGTIGSSRVAGSTSDRGA